MESSNTVEVKRQLHSLSKDSLIHIIVTGELPKALKNEELVNYFELRRQTAKLKRISQNIRVEFLEAELKYLQEERKLSKQLSLLDRKLEENMDRLEMLEKGLNAVKLPDY